jgi:hypothetical protein
MKRGELFVRHTYGFSGAEVILLDGLKRIDHLRYEAFVSSPADVFEQLGLDPTKIAPVALGGADVASVAEVGR